MAFFFNKSQNRNRKLSLQNTISPFTNINTLSFEFQRVYLPKKCLPTNFIILFLYSQGTTAAFTSILRQSNHNNIFPSSSTPTKDYMSPEYCMTPGCVQAAADILSNMDHSVNPCEDFYQFACGGFIEKTVIPDDRTRMSSFSVLSDELLTQVGVFYHGFTLVKIQL